MRGNRSGWLPVAALLSFGGADRAEAQCVSTTPEVLAATLEAVTVDGVDAAIEGRTLGDEARLVSSYRGACLRFPSSAPSGSESEVRCYAP